MTTESRDNILSRLKKFRQPMQSDKVPAEQADRAAVDVLVRELTSAVGAPQDAALSTQQKTERFIKVIGLVNGEVVRTSAERWLDDLGQHLKDNNIDRLLYAPGGGDNGQGAALGASQFEGTQLIAFDRPVEEIKDELFENYTAGISYAFSAIAHTGTLIVKTGPDEPRTISLVPPVNYIVLNAKTMYSHIAEAFADPKVASVLPTNLLLISGPSKTADIQQTLAYGAHGPKRLIVLLLE